MDGGGETTVDGGFDEDAGVDGFDSLSFTRGTFFFGVAGVVGSGSARISCTMGRPECGPRRLRMDEKCSQSW